MSLLTSAMEPCVIVNKQKVNDGYGGYKTEWSDGVEFNAAIVMDTSMQARVAQKQGVTEIYTITTEKSMTLEYHDVIRRLSDGKILRVTSNGAEKRTPSGASLDMRQVSAEDWALTS